MTKPKHPCVVCGKACQPHERTTDGTYLHTLCAMQLAGSVNLGRSG